MPESSEPCLVIAINLWSLVGHPSRENEWTLHQKISAVKEAGFDAVATNAAAKPDLKQMLEECGLRFGGACDISEKEHMAERIGNQLKVDNGPINIQLADDDTPVEDAIELTLALMEEAERQNADVHLEMHRDTCTETPEKTYAIAEAYEQVMGKPLKVNFDFSHPAIVKHLGPHNYTDRLILRPDLLQHSTLWHFRPFNGHHCQIPVTDGQGGFSPEFTSVRPFLKDALACWLEGPRRGNEFWVVPELGPVPGYGMSCFPCIWEDTVVLGNEIRKVWNELLGQ